MTVQIVSYGAGTNSTAMVCELVRRGEPLDAIVFADTGGERPETYQYVRILSSWLFARGYPQIVAVQTVDRKGQPYTLEERCIQERKLPSIAYGFKACSEKHKIRPQNKWANRFAPAKAAWKRGEKVVKFIGYDASEQRRADRADEVQEKKWQFRYPLIEWGWDRAACVKAIAAAELPQPGKSACFFCPSSKAQEILTLKREHPDLMARALEMEKNAKLDSIKGLGRNFAWNDLVYADDQQAKLFDTDWSTAEVPCGCYDG